jgi:hypothetical protein
VPNRKELPLTLKFFLAEIKKIMPKTINVIPTSKKVGPTGNSSPESEFIDQQPVPLKWQLR